MTKKPKLKLSELPDDIEVSAEGSSTTYTAAELKREILVLGEPHPKTKYWAVIEHQNWKPSAETMLEYYIDCEAVDLYDDADERLRDSIAAPNVIAAIQDILDKAMPGGFDYWTYGKDVEIDIFPPGEVESSE